MAQAIDALTELVGAEAARRIVEFRRDMHQHPEIGMDTARAADKIEAFLQTLPVEQVHRFAGNGVCAVIRGKKDGPMIGLRADTDALPIQEETSVAWKSAIDKCAHLCGHDGHTAGLLAAATLLAQTRDFAGSVVLIFQPGEEGWAGADKMIKDGLFERYPCREVFAIHGAPSRPLGTIAVREGAMTASVDIAYMTVEGRGGHGARPQETIDPMPAAAELILALQTIVARNINPADSAVVSCCFVQAGDPLAPTVIPQRVNLSATIVPTARRYATKLKLASMKSLRASARYLAVKSSLTTSAAIRPRLMILRWCAPSCRHSSRCTAKRVSTPSSRRAWAAKTSPS